MTSGRRTAFLEFNVYHVSQGVFNCSSCSCTFDWPMVDVLQKQEWTVWLTTSVFDCDPWKRKGNMESTMWKYTCGNIVHDTWKEYENWSMSLLMP